MGHVLPLSKRPRDVAAMMCSSLSFNPLCPDETHSDADVACRLIDGDAIKVYQGPIIHGLPFAVPLLLKGTVTPNKSYCI